MAVWLSGEHLTIAFADEALAQYGVTYQPDQRRLATVAWQSLCLELFGWVPTLATPAA